MHYNIKVRNGSPEFSITHDIQFGGSWGGVIEDVEADAVTGATKSSVGAAYHPVFNINGRMLETGIDFLNYRQSFLYSDDSNSFEGKREFEFAELRVPVTYNIQLFRNNFNEGRLLIKLGVSFGYRIFENINGTYSGIYF